MHEPILPARPKLLNKGGSETPAAFRNPFQAVRSGGAGRKRGVGKMNSRPALAFCERQKRGNLKQVYQKVGSLQIAL